MRVMTDPYMTALEARARLKLSRTRLDGLLRKGAIVAEPSHWGNGWIISRASVEAWAEKMGVDA